MKNRTGKTAVKGLPCSVGIWLNANININMALKKRLLPETKERTGNVASISDPAGKKLWLPRRAGFKVNRRKTTEAR